MLTALLTKLTLLYGKVNENYMDIKKLWVFSESHLRIEKQTGCQPATQFLQKSLVVDKDRTTFLEMVISATLDNDAVSISSYEIRTSYFFQIS